MIGRKRKLIVSRYDKPSDSPRGETVVAAVWLVFYAIAIGTAVASRPFSQAIEQATEIAVR